MLKKFNVLILLAASCVFYLPAQGAAFSTAEKPASIAVAEISVNNPVTPQRRRRRGWNNRNRRWNNNRRVRVIRQVYYRNGRRYIRYIRIYR